jgi:selenide,water dikinase
VRQGRPLHDNLRRSLLGQPLRRYRPQRHWLALIGTGGVQAVASRGTFFAAGHWVWRWKDWIDRRFMARFSDLPAPMTVSPPAPASALPLEHDEQRQALSAQAMRCGGCGAKVGASVLGRALARLPLASAGRTDVILGVGDDAAVLRVPEGKALVQSIDFFRAFIDDPYVFGRIAANHALGDLFAMGAQAHSALALATLPPGLESRTEELLVQLLSGALKTFDDAACALVGGHSAEGRELALGFSVNGWIDESLGALMTKSALRPGDRLLLTKPIGTGVLLVAHQKLRARGQWIDAALEAMMLSNQRASQILREHGVRACTDLTGFGLAGHLLEMSRPSGVDVALDLSALPLLSGALESAAAGHVSSLHESNAQFGAALRGGSAGHPLMPLLFDPQTAGGLLAGVPAAQAEACIGALRAAGYAQAVVIGEVLPRSDEAAPVWLKA